jgi:hypothetical protein
MEKLIMFQLEDLFNLDVELVQKDLFLIMVKVLE